MSVPRLMLYRLIAVFEVEELAAALGVPLFMALAIKLRCQVELRDVIRK